MEVVVEVGGISPSMEGTGQGTPSCPQCPAGDEQATLVILIMITTDWKTHLNIER